MVLLTLTSQGFSVYRFNWPTWRQSLLHLFTRSLSLLRSLHWLPVGFRILFKINLLTYKPCVKNSLFIFTLCLPLRFLLVHWDQTMIIVCQSLGSRPILVLELFTLVPRPFGTTCCCLSVQPFQLLPLRNIWRHISWTWPLPHRYRHSPWPVDVTELFPRFCCWTLIWLLHHWAWLRRLYWRYQSLIDWLIVKDCPYECLRYFARIFTERYGSLIKAINHLIMRYILCLSWAPSEDNYLYNNFISI